MNIYAPFLSKKPHHLFLHSSWLLLQVGYEGVSSGHADLSRGAFGAKLGPERRAMHEHVLKDSIEGSLMAVNLFGGGGLSVQ